VNIFLATFPMHFKDFLNRIDVRPTIFMSCLEFDLLDRQKPLAEIVDDPIKILASYHYFKKVNFDDLLSNFKIKPTIFADSGAYSASSQGVPVDIYEYADWLKKWKHYFEIYSNLDVIRNPELTEINQKILEKEGLNPIPVFHTGSDLKILDAMAEKYPYIALGGMVGQPRDACLRWAATCMKRTEKMNTKFHGFGMTSRSVIEKLHWYSVDSSSWVAPAKFGQMILFDGREWRKGSIGKPAEIRRLAPLIRGYGFDPEQFVDSAKYKATKGHINATILSALSWRKYEKFLQQKHSKQIKLYLAQNTPNIYFVETEKHLRRTND